MKTVTTRTTMPAAAVALFATAAVLAVLPSEGRRSKRKSKTHIHSPSHHAIDPTRALASHLLLPFLPLSAASCVNPHLSLSIGKCPRE